MGPSREPTHLLLAFERGSMRYGSRRIRFYLENCVRINASLLLAFPLLAVCARARPISPAADDAALARATAEEIAGKLATTNMGTGVGVLVSAGPSVWDTAVVQALRMAKPAAFGRLADSAHALGFTIGGFVIRGDTALVRVTSSRCGRSREVPIGGLNWWAHDETYRFLRDGDRWRFLGAVIDRFMDGTCD
jgi:hypothetical protein